MHITFAFASALNIVYQLEPAHWSELPFLVSSLIKISCIRFKTVLQIVPLFLVPILHENLVFLLKVQMWSEIMLFDISLFQRVNISFKLFAFSRWFAEAMIAVVEELVLNVRIWA
jgi:hypothetical protein